jgi:hypothetical protein
VGRVQDSDPIHYETAPTNDPIARLQQKLDRGQAHLSFDSRHGWLESVLRELDVPIDSQGLVFSKTSVQSSRISPRTPRAIYFNDDLYIGWVQGGNVIEIASVDPKNGTIFYSLAQDDTQRPRFHRENASCLQCHQSQQTSDVPGLLMRSVYPDAHGMPVFAAGTYATTDTSPMKERWGGWYMDGSASDPGMANGVANDLDHPDELSQSANPLSEQIDAAPYLSAHSDTVALMVLAHQTHLHNLLTHASYETRQALAGEAALRKLLRDIGPERTETAKIRIKSACEPVVQALFFSNEAPLERLVVGSTDFAKRFASQGPRDSHGRSLREFDLHRRLFKYPCSYLIYSEQFDSLPDAAKQYIYRRMWKILTGRDDSPAYNNLSDDDRAAIYQILAETKKDLSADWKKSP